MGVRLAGVWLWVWPGTPDPELRAWVATSPGFGVGGASTSGWGSGSWVRRPCGFGVLGRLPSLVADLVGDPHPRVRAEAAAVLERLAADPDRWVRFGVVLNGGNPC